MEETAARVKVEVPCVLCGCGEAEVRYRLGGYRVQRCRRCGLAAINPRFPEGETPQVYEAYFSGGVRGADASGEKCYADYIDDLERRRSRLFHPNRLHRGRLRMLERLTGGRRLLDVGCAAGFFLMDAREWGWEVAGLEASESAALYARTRGLAVATGILGRLDLGADRFDAVTLWDVVEHLHDPVGGLRSVRRALRPRGVLAMSTPNYDSVLRLVRGVRWHGFKLDEHLSLFTPQTLDLVLEAAGFEPLVLRTSRTELVRARRFLQRIRGRVPASVREALRLGQVVVNETFGRVLFLPWEAVLRGDMLEVYARRI